MQFKKITKPLRTSQEVLKQINNLIIEEKLRPGDRLMGEREMAGELGVSRTTLREALRTMEFLGWVEIKPGGGTFIRNAQLNDVISPLALALSVEPTRIDELWETRITLEVECAGLAASRASEEDLQIISHALRDMKSSLEDLDAYAKADMRFHFLITQASQNSMMNRLLQTFVVHILELIKKAGPLRFSHDIGGLCTIQEHISIYDAIVSHNAEQSKILMRKHLESSRSEG
ncbi:FadR/GntR family transcriptional regulator [Desulfosporosinus lacus]|uniref:GntR family transcriptional regulator, transcriptional repressor for pyruvate dehydrogenase complex n=1 Tax=Desulfosporosinus lacus DSM 15449 TaxID=1121420 RepID=A0A1M6DWQ8_9FIRM|nr:FadR/GntR family transcriptional regulator [Desulfosporosinus lacus]SHI77651.1 GntR family transcriptional regulator, transcriptional repressor for pyruvate dehydrogenase complex [Desulfosporosinus lacus DSM 15449]